jgi:hypothetical protein
MKAAVITPEGNPEDKYILKDQEKDDESDDDHDDVDSDGDNMEDTGLTENQNRLLFMISMYTRPATSAEEKEEWIRKPALMVLIYEGIVSQVLDYDYAPQCEQIEHRRKYFNMSQEGKSDLDFLREEELVNGLKLSSKSFVPVTCYQISEKGLDIIAKIGKADRAPVQNFVFAPATRNLLRVEWDGESYWLGDDVSAYRRISTVTETEDVSYVSSAYVPQCLRQGGRPTLSNAHRAHECAITDNNIRDELDEIITLNSVSIIVGEFIPTGANQIVLMNENLGSTERVQGGFFTALVDNDSTGTQINIEPGLTAVNILDYSLTNHINVEAEIHFPEDPGIVQVETFGISVHSTGSCFYGMQIEAVMDRIKDNISLDHLARLLVDVHTDSSRIIDSLISSYQRSLLDLIFSGDAPNRNKVNLIIANEITPHLTAEEYMDKGEYENELKQVLGDTRAAFDISEHDTLIFGAHGILVAGPNSRHHEPLLCSYLEFISMDVFTRNFFARMFITGDDLKSIKAKIQEWQTNPNSLSSIRKSTAKVAKDIILLEEILGYLMESLEICIIPPEPPEQSGRSLYQRLQISELKAQLQERTRDMHKNVLGLRRELDVLKQMSETVTDARDLFLTNTININTRNLCTLQDANQRSSDALRIMQVVLAGSLAFDILDRITGEWTVVNTVWMQSFVSTLLQTESIWMWCNLGFWLAVGVSLVYLMNTLAFRSKGIVVLRMHDSKKVDLAALDLMVRSKSIDEESHESIDQITWAKITWTEEDKRDWGGFAPTIRIEYDEIHGFMTLVELTYNRRKASKTLAFTSEELRAKLMQEFDKAGIYDVENGDTKDAGGAGEEKFEPFSKHGGK